MSFFSSLFKFFQKPPDELDRLLLLEVSKEKDGCNIKKCISFIHKGANVNAVNENGDTVLMWAAYNGHIEVVKILISMGVPINAKDSHADHFSLCRMDRPPCGSC